ncbi:DUF5367 family protein [Aneurinibacillus sp. BA2021]|nr:DUF5367 family protein [Aneurinibacillus sp. BA2021]
MKRLLLPLGWAVSVWAGATIFFVIFGQQVLVEPSSAGFWPALLLLEAGTAVCLYFITRLYIRMDSSHSAPLTFAICGSATGLFLDTFSLSHHTYVFAALSPAQVTSFAAWMSCAYALYLIIPFLIYHWRSHGTAKQSNDA